MHKFAGFNDQIKSVSEIYLPAVSSAAFYGRSIFTTAAVYNSNVFQWEKHWRRLKESADRLEINLSDFSETRVKNSAENLISANKVQNGRMRLTFFDETANGIWTVERKNETSLLITTADSRDSLDEIRLTVSPFLVNSKSPLANLKSGNYLENILALEESRKRGFDEAVRVNENGKIVSTVMANLFWVKDKKVYTSSLTAGALPGTTREFIKEKFQVNEREIALVELKSADEIFITSAGIGVVKVKYFEELLFENFCISNDIQKFFKEYVKN